MLHLNITAADANKAAAGVPLADQSMPMPNMKRVTSVHQAFVCQRYVDNNYLGTSTFRPSACNKMVHMAMCKVLNYMASLIF